MDLIFLSIEKLSDWLTHSVFSIEDGTLLAEAVNFFIYDTLKIFILLSVIIFAVTIIRSFIPPQKIKRYLSHKHGFVGNILAATLGIITPFCTCSAIPLFLGFIEVGVPVGVTFSFLIASPLINEVALALLFGLFGWKIALLYVLSGLLIAIISGIIIGRLNPEKLIKNIGFEQKGTANQKEPTWQERISFGRKYTASIIKKVWPYIIIGIGIGAFIHGYIPTDFLARFAGEDKWYSVPLATILGIPLYSNAAGVIPLVSALTEKGVAIGTALAFMMAVTGLSLPEFLILKRVMKTKLIIIFAGIVGLGIMVTGYLFNFILS